MRVLRWFARSGLIEPDDVREMLAWGNRLCSVDAGVCVAAQDRAGLKHVLHYFARPLYVRFVEHCCCLRPMVRCPLLAESGRSLQQRTLTAAVRIAVLAAMPGMHGWFSGCPTCR